MSYSKSTLAIDGTFKVNNLGYPLICLVTQDVNHRIYPIAFAPASVESGATISFVLQAVSRVYSQVYKKILKTKYFMSDCAPYIFTASKQVPGISQAKHLNCFFHLKENLRKKALAEHGVKKEDRKTILDHIDVMHKTITKEQFDKYWLLFKKKYFHYKNFTNYFEKTYINSLTNKWHYYDVEQNVMLTNNVCESLNAMIKRDWTNRERRPLHIFFDILKSGLMDLAKEK